MENNSVESILIVDDDPICIKPVKTMLQKSKYKVFTAQNGQECINLAKQLNPDLILLDIEMPIMNGLEACRKLKKDHATADMPVIFVTSKIDDETLRESFEAGGTDYVRKPVNRAELLARIKSAINQRKYQEVLIEKEKLTTILEMAGAICHELNQPLQAIYIYFDSLTADISKFSKENPIFRDVENVKNQIYRIGEITKKVSQIKKVERRDYIEGLKIIDIDKSST